MRWLFLFIIMFVTACKKGDEVPPRITGTTPLEQSSFDLYETLEVTAQITDDRVIERVELSLLDDQFSAVLPTKVFFPQSPTYNLNSGFILDDIHMETGHYFVKIQASDGSHETSHFIDVVVNGVPRELKDVVLVTDNAGQYWMNSLDSMNVLNQEYLIGSEFGSLAVNSWDGQVATSGTVNESFSVVDWTDKTLLWSVPGGGVNPDPHFTFATFDYSELRYIVATHDGTVFQKNKDGTSVVVSDAGEGMTAGTYCENATFVNEYLMVQMRQPNGAIAFRPIQKTTGVAFSPVVEPYDAQSMLEVDNEDLYVLGDQFGQPKFYHRGIFGGELEPHSLPAAVNDALVVDDNRMVFALADGLHLYTISSNSLVSIDPFVATDIAYDSVNGDLYAVGASSLKITDLSGTQQTVLPISAVAVEIVYNK